MVNVGAIVVIIFEILGVLTAIHAIMAVRSSQGAIAWALTLMLMPFLGLPLYWVFARNKFQGYVEVRRAHDYAVAHVVEDFQAFEQELRAHYPGNYARFAALEQLGHMPFTHGNSAKLLINGEATFESILSSIKKAERYILVQFYIVRDDAISEQIRDALVEKAREGVKVWFLYDRIGSHRTMSKRYIRSMIEGGVDFRAFKNFRGLANRFQINFRNHRKVVIVDGDVGFVGGHNVGDEYLGRDADFGEWRDTHVYITGPSVQCVQLAFIEDWYFITRQVLDVNWESSVDRAGEDLDIVVIPSGPADPLDTCGMAFTHAIHSAQKRLWIATPYFVPDEKIMGALRLAALRGVDVRLLVPYRPDNWLVYLASCHYIRMILQSDVTVYRYEPGFLHEKVLLIDDFSMVGTANLDNRSCRLNFELMLGFADADFSEQVAEMLEDDFSRSVVLTEDEFERASVVLRVGMRVARLLSPIL